LGQFGLGMISAIGKCERFTFTSCPAPHLDRFHEWIFPKDLVDRAGDLFIDNNPRPNLTLDKNARNKTMVQWRSRVNIEKFTTDKIISGMDIDELANAIRDRYAAVMRRNKVV